LAIITALAALLGVAWDAATQAPSASTGLVAADPQANALLSNAPERISLVFAEPVAEESARVLLLGAGGMELPLSAVQIDPTVPTRLVARPEGAIPSGDYTVVWSVRTADDGSLLAGAYAFRTGIVENPGAAVREGAWPEPWATVLRWLVFLGAAIATGGFAWEPLLTSRGSRDPGGFAGPLSMAAGALVALFATALVPVLQHVLGPAGDERPPLTETVGAMPLGWWIQLGALAALALICLGALASGRAPTRLRAMLNRVGLGAGLAALAGLSLMSHAAFPLDMSALSLEIAHQWSTALWVSGLLSLSGGWRTLGSDVARFRTVRWVGGALLAVPVLTGLARAWPLFPSRADLVGNLYGRVLIGKLLIVLIVVLLGSLVMVVPRRAIVVRASRSLVMQGALALFAAFLAALLALMASPGTSVQATLAGVALADAVPWDTAAFGSESGVVHLLTQPAAPGAQTLAVRLTDGEGLPMSTDPAPAVEVVWTPFTAGSGDVAPAGETTMLHADPSGALFTGQVELPEDGWWQIDVVVTPPGGIASRARFWLVLPDPNVMSHGPNPETDPDAQMLFERGLESLTTLRSVRYTQRVGDGDGSLYRSRTAVSAADGERPAAYDETVIDTGGNVAARQTIVGDRRWLRVEGEKWVEAEPIPFLTPAAWGASYVDATGFQLGPREEVDGELAQVVTFWQPPRQNPSRAPAWFAWWVGLASGEVRQEAMISTRHYEVSRFSDFDAPLGITPPVAPPAARPSRPASPPAATPAS
jgi:methionine-rich copper-binding protein CopC